MKARAISGGERRSGLGSRLREIYLSGAMVWAGALFLLALFALDVGLELQIKRAHDPLGGRFFPVLISSVLAIAVGILLLTPLLRALVSSDHSVNGEIRRSDEARSEAPVAPLERPDIRVGGMMLVSIAYVALLGLVGFLPATILAMFASLYILGRRGWIALTATSVLVSLAIYTTFTYALLVHLP